MYQALPHTTAGIIHEDVQHRTAQHNSQTTTAKQPQQTVGRQRPPSIATRHGQWQYLTTPRNIPQHQLCLSPYLLPCRTTDPKCTQNMRGAGQLCMHTTTHTPRSSARQVGKRWSSQGVQLVGPRHEGRSVRMQRSHAIAGRSPCRCTHTHTTRTHSSNLSTARPGDEQAASLRLIMFWIVATKWRRNAYTGRATCTAWPLLSSCHAACRHHVHRQRVPLALPYPLHPKPKAHPTCTHPPTPSSAKHAGIKLLVPLLVPPTHRETAAGVVEVAEAAGVAGVDGGAVGVMGGGGRGCARGPLLPQAPPEAPAARTPHTTSWWGKGHVTGML